MTNTSSIPANPQGDSFDIMLPAMRMGFARAISDLGMTPPQAEQKLASMEIFSKTALGEGLGKGAGTGAFAMITNFLKNNALATIAAGGLIGGMTGAGKARLEREIENRNDPDLQKVDAKIEGYRKLTDQLKLDRASIRPGHQPARTQEAMR